MGLKSKIKNFFKRRETIENLQKEFFENRAKLDSNQGNTLDFAVSKQPTASIIVVVSKKPSLNFLRSLKQFQPKIPYEVLLVMEPETNVNFFGNIQENCLFREEANLIKSLNRAIQNANGEYLYVVSDVLNAKENFLDELISSIDDFSDFGILSSQVEHQNQISDGFIFQGKLNLSQPKSTYHPEANYVRQTDFVSTSGFLTRTADASGQTIKFNENCESVDEAITDFSLWMKFVQGKKIWVSPFSRLIADNPETQNLSKLELRWKNELSSIDSKSAENRIETLNGKSVIVFCKVFPEHDRDSGSNRLKEIIFALKDLGFSISIFSKETYSNNPYIEIYQRKGIKVFYNFAKNISLKNYIQTQTSSPEFVWFYGPNVFHEFYRTVENQLQNTQLIYDMVDIHHLRFERAMELEPKRISLRKKYKLHKKIEINACKVADYVIAISDFEANYMGKFCAENKIKIISNLHYPKIARNKTLAFADRKDILFIGSTHAPNIDSIYYLFNEIMPLVWKKIPDLTVNIIGNVNEIIKDIQHPNFKFLGYVPDIEKLFVSNKLMVAPLRYGAGVKGKIGQALEYYLPTVTSSIGAEGMKLTDRENTLIEDSAEGFANAIIELYTNEALWQKIQDNSEESLKPFSIQSLKNTILSLGNE